MRVLLSHVLFLTIILLSANSQAQENPFAVKSSERKVARKSRGLVENNSIDVNNVNSTVNPGFGERRGFVGEPTKPELSGELDVCGKSSINQFNCQNSQNPEAYVIKLKKCKLGKITRYNSVVSNAIQAKAKVDSNLAQYTRISKSETFAVEYDKEVLTAHSDTLLSKKLSNQ